MADGDIQGTVSDSSGNAIEGAVVEVTRAETSGTPVEGDVVRTTTDANGKYLIDSFPDSDGTSDQFHVSAYYFDGSNWVPGVNRPGVTAALESSIPGSVIHHWPADEGSGTNIDDVEGTADISDFNGTWVTNSTFEGGTAPFFDGVDDISTASAQQPNAFTWAVKVRTDNHELNTTYTIFGHDLRPRLIYNGSLSAWVFDTGSVAIELDESPTNGAVRHLIAQTNGSTAEFYVYDSNKDLLYSDTGSDSAVNYTDTVLGVGGASTGGRLWQGEIDNWYFFNESLSADSRLSVLNSL